MRWYLAILVLLNASLATAATTAAPATAPATTPVDANGLLDQHEHGGAARALVDAAPNAANLRAAARLLAWYDAATDRSTLTKSDTAAIATMREQLGRHPGFPQACRQLLNEPRPTSNPTVTTAAAAAPPVVNYYYEVTVVERSYRDGYAWWWDVIPVVPDRPPQSPRAFPPGVAPSSPNAPSAAPRAAR